MPLKFLAFLLLFGILLIPRISFAQEDEINDPDEAGTSMPNVGILDAEPIVEIIEGVGSVLFANVAFRTSPDMNGTLIRYAAQGERVLIIGEDGEWLKVRMYDNAEAFISRKYVRMDKIARDEKITANDMDKKMSFIIADILDRFNFTVKNSSFAGKYKIIPYLNVLDERKVKGKMMLTFVYSCVDLDNKMIPSYNANQLQHEMRSLLEIMFSKLLLSGAESYELVIKVPVFGESGEVKDVSKVYATIELDAKDVDMQAIRKDETKIWTYVRTSMPVNKLFDRYP